MLCVCACVGGGEMCMEEVHKRCLVHLLFVCLHIMALGKVFRGYDFDGFYRSTCQEKGYRM